MSDIFSTKTVIDGIIDGTNTEVSIGGLGEVSTVLAQQISAEARQPLTRLKQLGKAAVYLVKGIPEGRLTFVGAGGAPSGLAGLAAGNGNCGTTVTVRFGDAAIESCANGTGGKVTGGQYTFSDFILDSLGFQMTSENFVVYSTLGGQFTRVSAN